MKKIFEEPVIECSQIVSESVTTGYDVDVEEPDVEFSTVPNPWG